jgi:acyl-CoA synthetase (AMP-forming)/AMP-acid ligase II
MLDAVDAGRIDLSHYLLDQWRLMHIGAQPVPPSLIHRWQKVFPNQQYDTNYGLSESIGPGCVHLGVENIARSAPSACPATAGRRRSWTRPDRRSGAARWAS